MNDFVRPAAVSFLLVWVILSSACGGGGGGSSPVAVVPAPDFSISVSSNALQVTQAGSATVNVTVTALNAFTSNVSIMFSGLPSGVTASPATVSVAAGVPQQITFSASATAATGTATVTVTGTSGSNSHAVAFSLQVAALATGANAPFRMRYLPEGGDVTFDLQNFEGPYVFYHQPTKRFFYAGGSSNQIRVFNATTEQSIGSIDVPGAWMIDETADGSTLYIGTQVGDIYTVDPVGMKVISRIPSRQIGSNGYLTFLARPLAGGIMALLGDKRYVPPLNILFGPGYTTYDSFAIWNPRSNSLTKYTTSASASANGTSGTAVCGAANSFATLAATADRTQLILTSSDAATICKFDPATGQFATASTTDEASVVVPPDGREFLVSDGANVYNYNLTSMQVVDQFALSPDANCNLLSLDGNTLYCYQYGFVAAYNWRTHAQIGWTPSPTAPSPPGQYSYYNSSLVPLAVDETGLLAGLVFSGVGFADGAALQTSSTSGLTQDQIISDFISLTPDTSGIGGGTQVQIDLGYAGYGSPGGTIQNLYFGSTAVSNLAANSSVPITVAAPAHAAGPVDVTVQYSTGFITALYQGFSYGPAISEISYPLATADGGGTEVIAGFGLVGSGGSVTGTQISVGGTQVALTNSNGVGPQFTIPPGSAGTSVDLTATTAAGSTVVSKAITYLPATQQFPLAGAQLAQGIYDAKRDVYYFTDAAAVQIFSRSQGRWLVPIAMPKPTGASGQRLLGIALSPDASKLAVSDCVANVIYVLNPDVPASVNTFTVPGGTANLALAPAGLAISNAGIVYFLDLGYGPPPLYKLDTGSGQVSIPAGYPNIGPTASILLTPDDQHVLVTVPNSEGGTYSINTATDAVQTNSFVSGAEVAISADGSTFAVGGWMTDQQLNANVLLGPDPLYGDGTAVLGEKFSVDGKLLFQPYSNAIDVWDVTTGLPVTQVALPVTVSSYVNLNGSTQGFDCLVSDGKDNVLVVITGTNGSGGVTIVDLSAVAEPASMLRKPSGVAAPRTKVKRQAPRGTAARFGVETQTGKDGYFYSAVKER